VRITEFSMAGGDGRFTASGTLPLALAAGETRLEWRAQQFRLLNRPDMRLVVSGQGSASFDGKKFGLHGELRADQGFFEIGANQLPKLDDDIVVAGRKREPRGARTRLPLDLGLRLDLGEQLALRGAGFEGRIAGQLQVVTNSAGELLAQGKVRAVNAKFQAYGQDLEVDPGILVFDGPLERPALQISAWRRNQQVEAGVLVTGTVDAPRVELISNPPVSEGEKLSWLVLGRPPGDASGADVALLQAAAGALLGGGNKAPINQRIAAAFGLDELTVRGSSELTTRVFALGKRLSDRLYISFEQGLGAAAENLVKLDFSLSQRWSARAQTGTTSGIGLFFRYAWD
jgi:translocation and assembly module TamB